MKNDVVVITGAGGVLCAAFAAEMARTGTGVALLDRNLEAAEKVAEAIRQEGGAAKAYEADVLDKGILEKVHEQVRSDFGPCRILINGAGGNSPRCTTDKETYSHGDEAAQAASFFSLDKEGFEFVFSLNLLGTLLPTQVFARDMTEAGTGCIVNISSMNAFRPLTKIPAYSAAKASVSNFTQWLAVHFAQAGIRVNAIAPGFFATNQNRALLFDEAGNPTPRTGKILQATPMGRFGRPEELLGTLRWLTDDAASGFVTGIVVPVDGGFSAYSGV